MNKKLLIFGLHDSAELAHYYFKQDSMYDVAGFVVTSEFMPEEGCFRGLPVYAYESIVETCPPGQYDFFAPIGARKMNTVRAKFYHEIKEMGYFLPSYISPAATVFDRSSIGENCFILEGSIVQPFVKVGNNTIIWGAHIGHHSILGDNVFVAKSVLCGHVDVKDNVFIGSGAAVAECRHIEEGSYICMSAAVITDTRKWSVYAGNPAMLQRKSSLDM